MAAPIPAPTNVPVGMTEGAKWSLAPMSAAPTPVPVPPPTPAPTSAPFQRFLRPTSTRRMLSRLSVTLRPSCVKLTAVSSAESKRPLRRSPSLVLTLTFSPGESV